MATLEDLERTRKPKVPPDPVSAGEELLIEEDLEDATVLLLKCQNLLNYLSDKDLCAALSKRERAVMVRVTDKIQDYFSAIAPHYEK